MGRKEYERLEAKNRQLWKMLATVTHDLVGAVNALREIDETLSSRRVGKVAKAITTARAATEASLSSTEQATTLAITKS